MSWLRRRVNADAGGPVRESVPPAPTDDAWRTLLIVVEWIKHAEAKAAATLAASGVLGGLLFTLVSQQKRPHVGFVVAAAVSSALITATAVAASTALRPRMRLPTAAPTNLLFYRSIADGYSDDQAEYVRAFVDLLRNRDELVGTISAQVWANSVVATRKYRALSLALNGLFAAIATLAVTAVLALVI